MPGIGRGKNTKQKILKVTSQQVSDNFELHINYSVKTLPFGEKLPPGKHQRSVKNLDVLRNTLTFCEKP